MSIPDIIGAEWGSFSPFASQVSQAAAVEAQRTLAPTPFVPRVQPSWLAPAVQDVHTNYVNKLYQQWLAFMRDPYNTNLNDVVYLIQNLRKMNRNDIANSAQYLLDRVRAVRSQPLSLPSNSGPVIVWDPAGYIHADNYDRRGRFYSLDTYYIPNFTIVNPYEPPPYYPVNPNWIWISFKDVGIPNHPGTMEIRQTRVPMSSLRNLP